MADKEKTKTEKRIARKQEERRLILSEGKVKQIGVLEKFLLKRAGKKDAKTGLPREGKENDLWQSPFIENEIAAYKEFCTKEWGHLQIDDGPLFSKLQKLLSEKEENEKRFKVEEEQLIKKEKEIRDEVQKRQESMDDDIPETVKEKRCTKEVANRMRVERNRYIQMKESVNDSREEINRLYGDLTEDFNTVKLICDKLKNRTKQRIILYWDGAVHHHEKKDQMPVYPEEILKKLEIHEDELYQSLHQKLLDVAVATIGMAGDPEQSHMEEEVA